MLKKFKVLHIITRLDKGGSAINTLSSCVGLSGRGYIVSLAAGLSLESDMAQGERVAVDQAIKEAGESGVRLFTLPMLVRRIHPIFDLIVFFQLMFLIRREKFHIVHTHTSKAGIIGRWAAFFAGTPIIIHTPHGHVFSGYFGELKTRLFIFLESASAAVSDSIITLTDKCMEEHIHFGIAKRAKFRTIHSGVPLDRFASHNPQAIKEIKKVHGIPEDALIVGSAGRLVPIKGYEDFLQAAALIKKAEPRAFFIIMGEGPLREDLSDLARKLDLTDSLLLPGWREDLSGWLHTMDVFLLTSLNEGMGRVLVEAMACGLPVVATEVGGVPSVVDNGANGFLVPAQAPEIMAQSVLKLLADPGLRSFLGENGRKKAGEFSLESMVDKIDNLYSEWTGRKAL